MRHSRLLVMVLLGGCAQSHAYGASPPGGPAYLHAQSREWWEGVGSSESLLVCLPSLATRCRVRLGVDGDVCREFEGREVGGLCELPWTEEGSGPGAYTATAPDECGRPRDAAAHALWLSSEAPLYSEAHVDCELDLGEGPPPSSDLAVGGWRSGEEPPQVGRRCELPEGVELDERVVYLRNSASCDGLPCMTYRVGARPPPEDVADQLFCTCRCSSLEGDPTVPLCACPMGLHCQDDLFSFEGTGVGGGYCVPCREDETSLLGPDVFEDCG